MMHQQDQLAQTRAAAKVERILQRGMIVAPLARLGEEQTPLEMVHHLLPAALYEVLHAGWSAEDKGAILGGNARELFGLPDDADDLAAAPDDRHEREGRG